MNKTFKSIGKEPEFTAYELNKLKQLARKSSYYQKVENFVDRFMSDSITWDVMSEKQRKWLCGIKQDLEMLLREDG